MRNKNIILAAIGIVLILVGILAALFLSGGGEPTQTDTQDPFGDTSGDRPFGNTSDERPGYVGTSTLGTPGEAVPVLRLLSDEPVAGVGTVSQYVGEVLEPFTRFTLSENGHTLELPLTRIAPPTILSLTTVPGVQEALWAHGASTTLLRYLDRDASTVYTWLGSLEPHTGSTGDDVAPYELSGAFLEDGVIAATLSPDGGSMFYITVDPEEGTRGYVENLASGSRTQVWRSPLRELSAHWGSRDELVVYTRPSHTTLGYAWKVNTRTGATEQIINGAPSLTATLNPTGTLLLYSTLEGKLPSLRTLALSSEHTGFLPFVTLPEKCTWSRKEPTVLYCAVPTETPLAHEYPDGWYQGKTSFSDALWRINTATQATTLLAEPQKMIDAELDAVDLTLSEDEAYLIFRSRGDDRLWSLTLPAPEPTAGAEDGAAETTP